MMQDALDRLDAASELAGDGQFDAALRELQWFHEQALEHDPSLYGVRLSYALHAWVDLGADYQPALDALLATRERDAALLLAGKGKRGLFHDVVAIDEELGQGADTHVLCVALERTDPVLLAACADIALPAIIAAGDYALAERLLPDPGATIGQRSRSLMKTFSRWRRQHARTMFIGSQIGIYAADVRQVLEVLVQRGRHAEAARLRRLAVELIPATTVRRAVRAALYAS
ncbi:hypothetical protein [Massilia sp. H6]|uniref:hypothetical protein n=1 Tax=Massilia sp. H6 TaxID=2970464 RepID=UPI00216811F5|nr:hypothetical protein [Massilia sp. H6]UVW29660.1 hypothetical protein NRS07_05910 [Massilia sp. H6]